MLGIDYFEFSHNITTKCVIIIRHKHIDVQKFIQLQLKKEEMDILILRKMKK